MTITPSSLRWCFVDIVCHVSGSFTSQRSAKQARQNYMPATVDGQGCQRWFSPNMPGWWHLCCKESNTPLVKMCKVCWYRVVWIICQSRLPWPWSILKLLDYNKLLTCWEGRWRVRAVGLDGLVESYEGHLSLCSLEEQMLLDITWCY
jgi:hypothetical protein